MIIKKIDSFYKFLEIYPTSHSESKLYINNNELIKIIRKSFLDDKRRQNILELDRIKHPNCVKINYAVANKNNDVNGYSMEYLYDYITLSKYITKNNIPFKDRIILAHKICEIIDDLKQIDFSFVDIHSDNFLIKNNDLKLIDLDSGIFKFLCSEDSYNFRNDFVSNYLADLCFQILLGTDIDLKNDIDYSKKVKLFNNSTQSQRVFLYHAFDNLIGNFIPNEYIDLFDENKIDDIKKILNLKR